MNYVIQQRLNCWYLADMTTAYGSEFICTKICADDDKQKNIRQPRAPAADELSRDVAWLTTDYTGAVLIQACGDHKVFP